MLDALTQNGLLRMTILAVLFAAVAAVSFIVVQRAAERRAARGRLVDSTGEGKALVRSSLRNDQVESAWLNLVNSIEAKGLSLVDTKDATVRQTLIAAGFTAPHAPRVYTLLRLVLVLALPIAAAFVLWLIGASPTLTKLYFVLVISAAVGLYAPSLFIRIKADRRKQELINGFPDALDLLLVCVEAGLGLEAAFARVGMELTTSHPLLAEQFGSVVLELRAGRSHEDALRRMADRAGSDDIRAFATLLVQSAKLGSSIAQTLRTYSKEMREKRRLRAEEKAHRLPVLISIPLVTCMLPAMIGVLMLPAVIRVARALLPALHGGG
jgi:tight adherence protein C